MKKLLSPITAAVLLAGLLGSTGAMAQTTTTTSTQPTGGTVAGTGQKQDFSGDLAKASLAKQGITNPTPSQLADARQSISDQRAKGMGWGQIANSLGLNLGKVVSEANHERNEARKADATAKRESATKTQHSKAGKSTSDSGNTITGYDPGTGLATHSGQGDGHGGPGGSHGHGGGGGGGHGGGGH